MGRQDRRRGCRRSCWKGNRGAVESAGQGRVVLRRRPTAVQLVLILGVGVATMATSSATTAAATPSGIQRARAQLPELGRQAQTGIMNRNATATGIPPSGAVSQNIQFLANLPIPSAISLCFIGNTLFPSTLLALSTVPLSAPANPQLLGALPMYIW